MSDSTADADERWHELAGDIGPAVGMTSPAIERRGSLRPMALATSRSRAELGGLQRLFRVAEICIVVGLALDCLGVGNMSGLLSAPLASVLPIAVGAAVMCACLGWTRPKMLRSQRHWRAALGGLAVGLMISGIVLLLLLAVLPLHQAERQPSLQWFGLSAAAVTVLRGIWLIRLRQLFRAGKLTPNIVIVGATANAAWLIARAHETRDVAILGVFDDRSDRIPPNIGGVKVLGKVDSMFGHRIMPYVDRVVITVSTDARERLRELTARLHLLPNEISLLVDVDGEMDTRGSTSGIAGIPLSKLSGHTLDEDRIIAKRLQDVVLGSFMLLLLAPFMAIIGLAVKLDSKGPVFFRQRRHGFNNEIITVWKFRTMRVDLEDQTASLQIQANDCRVTRVGRFIRRTSLDELPQLFNVLRGEMSLVGPRPHAVGMRTGDEDSARLVAEYAHRHRIKPGMTGWAAINGSRGAVDTVQAVRRRVALDVAYIERQSFWLDLYIIVMTLPCLLGDRTTIR